MKTCATDPAPGTTVLRIKVMPLGSVAREAITTIQSRIVKCLKLPTEIFPPGPYPVFAFDETRLQYDAGKIIQAMEAAGGRPDEKVVGVFGDDLFIPIFTHVFGEARQDGGVALVSLFRMENNHERSAKVALHELGHLLGLQHCLDSGCLMYFSGDLAILDRIPFRFCRYCSAYLETRVGPAPAPDP